MGRLEQQGCFCTFLHDIGSTFGYKCSFFRSNNCSLVCKKSITIKKKIVSASPGSVSFRTLLFLISSGLLQFSYYSDINGQWTENCFLPCWMTWRPFYNPVQSTAGYDTKKKKKKDFGVLRFSLASLQLHVPPECSQTVFEPQFEPKSIHIQDFIAAAGHCGLGQQLLSCGKVSSCHPGSHFFSIQGPFWLVSSVARLPKKLCTRTVLKFCVSQMPATFQLFLKS